MLLIAFNFDHVLENRNWEKMKTSDSEKIYFLVSDFTKSENTHL